MAIVLKNLGTYGRSGVTKPAKCMLLIARR